MLALVTRYDIWEEEIIHLLLLIKSNIRLLERYSTHPSIYPAAYLTILPFIHPAFDLPIYPFICLFSHIHSHLPTYPCFHPPIYLPTLPYTYLATYPHILFWLILKYLEHLYHQHAIEAHDDDDDGSGTTTASRLRGHHWCWCLNSWVRIKFCMYVWIDSVLVVCVFQPLVEKGPLGQKGKAAQVKGRRTVSMLL